MRSKYAVQQLSRGDGPAVHRYYDVPLEEPEGARILYYEFDSPAIPGPGRVMVAGPGGENPQVVAATTAGIGHVGANQTWCGPGLIAFRDDMGDDASPTILVDLATGERQTLGESLRSYSLLRRQGLVMRGGGGHGGKDAMERYRHMRRIHLWDHASGETTLLVEMEAVAAVHPDAASLPVDHFNFQNPKWSPDGRRMLVVVGDEVYAHPRGETRTSKWLAVLTVTPDGRVDDIRYAGELTHHPMWTPDSEALIGHLKNDRGGQDLVRYGLDGAPPAVLIPDFDGIHSSFDRAGRRVVTDGNAGAGMGRINLYDLETGERRTLAEGAHGDWDHRTGCHPHPQWSRDESRIFFNLGDTGVPQVYAVTLG